MALNIAFVNTTTSITNASDSTYQLTGWKPSDTNRGSIDILWSCCITVILCCWVSTFPNATSLNDKWFHGLVDKFNLACVGLAGPSYLFTIALGQLSSARRSVRLFRKLPRLTHGKEWTLVHGFFADMGGFTLNSPDYPPFPINAEQLHYLIENGHVDFPNMSKLDIKALSKVDGLSKLIILWQVLWFSASELQRLREGLPMTTFELTALAFSLTMLVTSLCWYSKPTISVPTTLYTKDTRSIEHIRAKARESTHPSLGLTWYRTPLDFISPSRRFRIDVHWCYYAQISYMAKIPLFTREIKARPWDRLPSDAWLLIDRALLAPAAIVIVGFGVYPLAAWNFHFPTEGERIAWRVCSVYHALFTVAVVVYYIWVALRESKIISEKENRPHPFPCSPEIQQDTAMERPTSVETHPSKACYDVEAGSIASGEARTELKGAIHKSIRWLRNWRNISPDGDPDMEIGLRVTLLPLINTILYMFCRLFFYVEGFASIRQQPLGVYKAMNKYLPFMN